MIPTVDKVLTHMKLVFTLNKNIENKPRTTRSIHGFSLPTTTKNVFHIFTPSVPLLIYYFSFSSHLLQVCWPAKWTSLLSWLPCSWPMDDTRKILGKWLRYVFPSFFPRLLASLPLVWDYGDKGNFVVQHFFGYFNLKPTSAHLHFLVYYF